jgi:hypothetical protein
LRPPSVSQQDAGGMARILSRSRDDKLAADLQSILNLLEDFLEKL